MTHQTGLPPWRVLGLLAAAVLAVHALALQTQPARFGPAQASSPQSVTVMTTRSIESSPPVATSPLQVTATPPALTSPKSFAKPAEPEKKPVFKQKVPVAQEQSASIATNSIASAEPPVSANEAPEPPAVDSAAAATGLPTLETVPAVPLVTADSIAAASDAVTSQLTALPPQTPVTAMALPASAQLQYKMTGSAKGLTYHAQGELLWQQGGGSYSARMTAKALFVGSRTMTSTGQVGDQGLAPSRFSDKSRTELAAHFEPDKGQISFSANTPSVPWTPGAQDRISVFLQLGGMLAGNPAGFPLNSTISSLTVGPRAADYWTFVVEKEELLSLPFGELATVKLARQPRRDYDQKVELWYAPALGYLPVRSRITQANGDFVDQQLSELTRP